MRRYERRGFGLFFFWKNGKKRLKKGEKYGKIRHKRRCVQKWKINGEVTTHSDTTVSIQMQSADWSIYGKILWPVNREVHGGRPSERRGNKVVEEGRIDNPICYIGEYFGWIDSCDLPKRKTLRSKDRLVYICGQPLDFIKIIYRNDGTAEDKKECINIESMNDIIEI